MKLHRMALLFLFGICMTGSGCGGRGNHGSVIVAGSTSVQPYAEILAEEYAHFYPEHAVDVQGGGSSAGITAVESGAADIGMSSRKLSEKEQYLWSVEIAKDGLAVIIHPANRLEDLTIEQVRGIYSGQYGGWNDVGGRDAKIHVVTREEGSGTRSAFEDLVMEDALIAPTAIVQDSNGAVRQLISNDPNAIGFISLGLVDSSVRALRLGGVEASWENITNGRYSLFRPFLFVTNGTPEGMAKAFIDYSLSAEGQRLLLNEGLVEGKR